jgi:hypothetical protein
MHDAHDPTLFDRFLALPRVMQWASLAVIGLLVFLIWDSFVKEFTDDINLKSDRILAQVREVQTNRTIAADLRRRDTEALVTSVGLVATPRSEATGGAAFTDVVNGLVKKHGIADDSFSLRAPAKLPKTALQGALPPGKRAERVIGDLKFSAKPEVAMAILADIESSPDIEQVSSVRLTKDTNGKIKAHFVLEAWVIASDAGGAAASSGAAL